MDPETADATVVSSGPRLPTTTNTPTTAEASGGAVAVNVKEIVMNGLNSEEFGVAF